MKRFLLIALVIVVAIPLVRGGLNYSGFCIAEGRWLSDEEILDVAIEKANEGPWLHYFREFEDTYREYTVVKHNSVDEFKENNPDCCHITEEYRTPPGRGTFSKVAFGNARYSVSARYVLQLDHSEQGRITRDIENQTIWVSNCGKAWNYRDYN